MARKASGAVSRPSSSSRMPPAMRKAASEMPKNCSSPRPVKKKKPRKTTANRQIMAETEIRWRREAPAVAAAKIGTLPMGSSRANSATNRLTPRSTAFIASPCPENPPRDRDTSPHLSGHPRAPASRREPEMSEAHSVDLANRPFDPRVICALDVPTTDDARALVERIGDAVGFYKVGLQLFASDGMALARELKASGAQVFLDWKLHDIGATVEKATAVLANAGCDLLTVHARPQVMAAAARGAAGSDLKI